MSLGAHEAVFAGYDGMKVEFRRAVQLDPPEPQVLALLESIR